MLIDNNMMNIPISDKLYNAEKARASEVNAKRKRLRQIEENLRKAEMDNKGIAEL